MQKEEIIKQIIQLPIYADLVIPPNEMAEDLQEIMKDNEKIKGIIDACEKTFLHFMKNGRLIRSFIVITNENFYLICKSRKPLKLLSWFDSTSIIPWKDVITLRIKEVSDVLKIFYGAELRIISGSGEGTTHSFYLGTNYKKGLPAEFFVRKENSQEDTGIICSSCGHTNGATIAIQ